MFLRLLLGGVMVVGIASLGVQYAVSDDQPGTHAGVVVSVEGNRLTMSDKDGKNERTYIVQATATTTCDGKVCRLQDLRKGMPVSVTVERQGEKNTVTRVDAKKVSP